MKKLVLMLMSVASLVCLADGTTVNVSSVSARQRSLWDGRVEIDCEVSCNDPQTPIKLVLSARDRGASMPLAMNHVWLEGDATHTNELVVTAGKWRLVWDAGADAPDTVSSDVAITVRANAYGEGDPVPSTYLVIDLSGGKTAERFPVEKLDDVPQGGWTDEYKTDKLVLRLIQPGTFTMGCARTEIGYNQSYELFDALPHAVTISSPFYMGVFEVTQRQWELVMGTRPSYFSNSDCYQTRPVEQVSWEMIRGRSSTYRWPDVKTVDPATFIGQLQAKTGLDVFDLPTEAQWEYACRAGTTTALNNGKNLVSTISTENLDEVGRCLQNFPSGNATYTQSSTTDAGTAAVGSYLPNAWGLYDMHGNVYEWCLDYWRYRSGFTSAETDPVGPSPSSPGAERVVRGGSWAGMVATCRAAYRVNASPQSNENYYGFRLSSAMSVSFNSRGVTGFSVETSAAMRLDTRGGSAEKIAVPIPEIVSLTYTGSALSAGVAESEVYSVVGAGSWTDVGEHEIVFILKNPMDCRWATSDELFVSATFSILPASLTDEMVGLIPEQHFVGDPLEPGVQVAWNGTALVQGVDYTVVYADNDGVGQGRVTVTGRGNFSGTVVRTFRIERHDGVAGFAAPAVVAAEGGTAVVQVKGGHLDRASSVQVVATYNTAAAQDLDLKGVTVDGAAVKAFKFPVTLTWAKGDLNVRTIEIPVVADKALEAGEFLTLQLADPQNMRLADGAESLCTVSIVDPGYEAAKAKVAEGSATKAETNNVAKADKVFDGKFYVRAFANDPARGKVTGSALAAAGKKVTLKATANKGFVFVGWYDGWDGEPLSQTASWAFTMPARDVDFVAKFVTAEEDAASLAAGVNGISLDGAETTLATNVMAGVYLRWPLAAEALSLTSVSVSGLPAGLKFTAKGVVDAKTKQVTVPANTIYGVPTAASKADKAGKVVPSSVKIAVTTAGKTKRVYTLALTVDQLPDWAVGTFNGAALADAAQNGLATLTIAKTGKVSGKLLADGFTWTLAAPSFTSYSPEAGFAAMIVGTSGKQAFTNELSVTADALGGRAASVCLVAGQNTWKADPWKARAATFGKVEPVTIPVDGDQPGEIVLKFATSGAVTAAGAFRTGVDAKGRDVVAKATCATVVCPDGEPDEEGAYTAHVFVYFPPKGAFAGYSACLSLRWDGASFVP